MKIFKDYANIPDAFRGSAVALGNFDGIHPGHQVVINEARREAVKSGAPFGVIAFEPHTREFFQPDAPSFRLTSCMSKARVLEALGVEVFFVVPFDKAMAQKSAEDFIREVLVDGLGVAHVVIGADFQFGRERAGDAGVLKAVGQPLGLKSTAIDLLVEEDAPGKPSVYSSTQIRGALRRGNVARAAEGLGRPWAMDGIVVEGDKRGRTIGFPTANVLMGHYIQPALGVCAVRVEIPDGPHAGLYDGVANIGNRPTFDKKGVVLEAHLFDFEGDIYGQEIFVYFIDYIRPERKFDGLDSLKAQIKADCATAREILAKSRWKQDSLPL